MDFSKIKAKAKELKDKAVEFKDKTLENTATKVGQSSLVMKTQSEVTAFIEKSENKTFVTQEWATKNFTKRVFLVVGDSTKDFYKEFLFLFPVLITKAFSQNVSFKVVDIQNKEINLSEYGVWEVPALLVFEDRSLYKTIVWEENIKKVVKSLSLDINKTVEEL